MLRIMPVLLNDGHQGHKKAKKSCNFCHYFSANGEEKRRQERIGERCSWLFENQRERKQKREREKKILGKRKQIMMVIRR